jgi:hypothetical protein
VYVVKRHHIAGFEGIPQSVRLNAGSFQDLPYADMARDDGIGDTGELPVKEVDVSAAHLTGDRLQKDRPRLEDRVVQLPDLHRRKRSHHDCSSYAHPGKVEGPWGACQKGGPAVSLTKLGTLRIDVTT